MVKCLVRGDIFRCINDKLDPPYTAKIPLLVHSLSAKLSP